MPKIYSNFFYKSRREVEQNSVPKPLTPEEASKYYADEDYETYFIEYTGNFIDRINKIDFAYIYVLSKFFAAIYIKKGMLSTFLKDFPEITNIEKTYPFTLLSLDKSEVIEGVKVPNKEVPTDLQGEGVIVGIIGTGIDYLNPRFINDNGETRILTIWDQSLNIGPKPKRFLNGTEFTKEQINEAIKANEEGKNPYDIVNHRDENGYGTALAGIIGGRNINESYKIDSIAPKCEFSIVKLKEAKKSNLLDWGVENFQGSVFDSTDIAAATRYFYELQEKLNKPFVVLLTVGSNFGGHDGSTIEERYIDYFAQGRRFSVIMSTGDQGDSQIHYKGECSKEEVDEVVNINIDRGQENLFFSLHYFEPDKISIGITSPTGESIENIDIKPINGNEINIILGGSFIKARYFIDKKEVGNQRIDFMIRNVTVGMWKIKIIKDYISNGNYNIWLQQKQFSVGNTGLENSSSNITLMTPSTANHIIVTSSFNKEENKVIKESGNGFTRDNRINPTVGINCKEIKTIGLENKPISVTGVAASGAILAGIVVLLFQWGIVEQNDINMHSSKIKSYLMQGTIKEKDKVYPNPETGFGVLNFEKILSLLNGRSTNNNETKNGTEVTLDWNSNDLYIKIPKELYNRVRDFK